jgi:hypothetical protein
MHRGGNRSIEAVLRLDHEVSTGRFRCVVVLCKTALTGGVGVGSPQRP